MSVDQAPMNQLITDNIDTWTSTVKTKSTTGRGSSKKHELYGVKKLRELILELAVRGKLVPQDPNDEPASVLLERIAAEKAQLVRENKLKNPKKLSKLRKDEIPFDIPESWEWIRLGEVGYTQTGGTPKKANQEHFGSDVPFIKPADITELKVIYDNEGLSTEGAKALGRIAPSGSVLMVCIGTIGKCQLIEHDCAFNQQINSVTPFLPLGSFIFNALRSNYFSRCAWERSSSTTIAILNKGKWESIAIPLPPVEEQHRIVAKVDELMTLCDQLEQQTETSIDAHQVLVTTLLDSLLLSATTAECSLTNSANAEDNVTAKDGGNVTDIKNVSAGTSFDQNWQMIAEHFDTLFTTEASIDTLKQTILQLAVMGKLVPQDPNDEPAAKLLERIAQEKAQLIKDKVYQKTSKLKPKNELISYPTGWIGVQTGQVCPSIVPNRDRPKSFTGNIPWVTLPAFPLQSLYLDSTKVELALTETEVQKYSARLIPAGSVLMSCVGRFGLTAINTVPVTSNQQVHGFITLKGLLPEYLSMVIRVEGKFLESVATSTTIAYLNKTNCESIQFGLPPENEQRLIVEKAKELIDLCEQLKGSLNESQATQLHLTDAIVEQAV